MRSNHRVYLPESTPDVGHWADAKLVLRGGRGARFPLSLGTSRVL